MGAHADANLRWRDSQEEAGHGALALALPEPEVEVVLVGRRVFGEADVAVDPEDRPVHLWLGLDRSQILQRLAGGFDERLGRLDPVIVVFAAMRIEPLLVVVLR